MPGDKDKNNNKKLFGNRNLNTDPGTSMPSGVDTITGTLLSALGALIGSDPNISDPKKAQAAFKKGVSSDKERRGFIGILNSIDKTLKTVNDVISGDNYKAYIENAKINSEKTKDLLNVITTEKVNSLFDNVSSIKPNLEAIATAINGLTPTKAEDNTSSTSSEANISVSGNDDLAKLLETIKSFTLDNETIQSLNKLAELTASDGSIGQIFNNIDELNKKNVDIKSFNEKMEDINDAAVNSTAIDGQISNEKIKSASDLLSSISQLLMSVALLGGLLLAVGLLADKIDFVGLAKFEMMLLTFLLGLTLVFVMANRMLKKDGPVLKGLDEFTNLVVMASLLMLLGGYLTKFISLKDLLIFTQMLRLFVYQLLAIFADAMNDFDVKDINESLKEIRNMVIASSIIMIFGSMIIKYIKIKDLLKFTLYLGVFIFSIMAVMSLTHTWLNNGDGFKAMKEAMIVVAVSALVMLLGSAFVGIIKFKNLIKFTVALAGFLIVILGIFAGVSWIWKKEGEADYKNIMIVVVGAALVMLIGSAFIGLIKWQNLFKFTLWLSLFLAGVMLPFLMLKSVIKDVKQTAISILLLVTISSVILMTGGFLFMKYPKLEITVPLFGFILSAFILSMTFIIWLLSKIDKKNLIEATAALLGISLAIGIVAGAFMIIAEVRKTIDSVGGNAPFEALIWTMVGVLAVLSLGLVGLGTLLGNPASVLAVLAAIGVVLAASAAFGIVAYSMLTLADALDKLSMIESFDVTPIVNVITSLITIMTSMKGLILYAPGLALVEAVMLGLTLVVSKMAETVKEYADLKIGIYDGTKLIGYRHLSQRDFSEASKNISLLVSTLSAGIMQAYEAHPEWYSTTSWTAFWSGGQSPLMRVIRQSRELAPLISRIASAVKSYASLKIAEYNDKSDGTKITGYRTLSSTDFDNAAKNISTVVTTLSAGIMQAYEAHPEWYGDIDGISLNSISTIINKVTNGGQSPIMRVIKQSKMLGPLISSIAKSVQTYVNLKVPTKWNEKGEAVEFRKMQDSDFTAAAKNVSKVVTTLGKGIMDVYEGKAKGLDGVDTKSWFKEDWGGFGKSPFEKVIDTNKKLAKLISTVSHSVKDYADLKIAEEFDSEGKGKSFRRMTDNDFVTAASNVTAVLVTLGTGVMGVYKDHNDWFKDDWFSDSPFIKVIDVNKELAKLITTVAHGVKDYADLKMPTGYDKDGKPTGYRSMNEDDFKNAAKNISTVVTTAALGLMGYDPDGNPLPAHNIIEEYMISDNDDKYEAFNRVLDASVKIGNVVSSLAQGISNFSKMMIPKKWDANGNPIDYENLEPESFSKAAQCITTVITTVADALMTVINEDAARPDGERIWNIDDDFEKSPLFRILSASEKMGGIIGNIAEGIANYASMKIPVKFDKNGKPIDWIRLTDSNITKAITEISTVLGTMAGGFLTAYENGKNESGVNLWDLDLEDVSIAGLISFKKPVSELSPLERVINASVQMGIALESIARGIVMFAAGEFGPEGNPVKIDDPVITVAQNAITKVLTTLVTKINELSTLSIFENEGLDKIIGSITNMTNVVSGIATAVQNIAGMSIPQEWDNNGKPTKFIGMDKIDFDKVGQNIEKILTAIGNAFKGIVNDPNNDWLDSIDDSIFAGATNFANAVLGKGGKRTHSSSTIGKIMNSIMTMAMTLSIMSGCIVGYATMKFPMGVDDNGNVIYSDVLTNDNIEDAKTHIQQVMSALGGALIGVMEEDSFKRLMDDSSGEKMDATKITDFVEGGTGVITGIGASINQMLQDENVKSLNIVSGQINNLKDTLINVTSSMAELLFVIFAGQEEFNKYKTENNKFAQRKVYSFANVLEKYSNLANSQNFSERTRSLISNVTGFLSQLKQLSININDTSKEVNSLYSIFSKRGNEVSYTDKIDTTISGFDNLVATIKKVNNIDQTMSGKNAVDPSVITEELIDKMRTYGNFVKEILTSLSSLNSSVSNFNAQAFDAEGLLEGIININTAFGNVDIRAVEKFKAQTTQLEKFVKKVNEVKLLNLDKLNKFINSLNQLANKMGNLDNLTDAIANKLTNVLTTLVNQLNEVDKTITKADEIQKQREKIIKNCVDEVKVLMQQPMTVDIRQVNNTEQPPENSDNKPTT